MRSVMITGASRGIGLEFVRQHLADGCQVYATCHKIAGAEQLMGIAVERMWEN
jgi:NAD(P)-dependent dehydrogenase (short-subunit alcohol dehydrogenase family)